MAPPSTTIVPFADLPACAAKCGPLYDANGACVPPVNPNNDETAWDTCFCDYDKLQPFSAGAAGVCDGVCDGSDDMGSIHNWFTSFCGNIGAQEATTTATTTGSSTSTASSGQSSETTGHSTTPYKNNSGHPYSWIDGHWQWVVFLVVMVVGIVGIWVGACFWRRRYLRKKDRQYQLGRHLSRAAGDENGSTGSHLPTAGAFDPAPISSAGIYNTEKKPKKWTVSERT